MFRLPPLRIGLLAVAMLGLGACRRAPAPAGAPPRLAAGEFSLMTYNLHQYAQVDRDGDGQADDPKPAAERAALIRILAIWRPDILAVQEIGNPAVFEEFRFALHSAGLAYTNVDYLQRGQSENNLAVLSRFPITARRPHTDDEYSIGPAQVPVSRGFIEIDIEVRTNYVLTLMVAHLKSKVFHSLGQTEMRRNEARLLNNHVRRAQRDNPEVNLAVVGDFNDSPNSAALRELRGEGGRFLRDLRPADDFGSVWTYFERADDTYSRIDYLLASPGLEPEVVRGKCRVVMHPLALTASDHRAVFGVFRSTEGDATGLPGR